DGHFGGLDATDLARLLDAVTTDARGGADADDLALPARADPGECAEAVVLQVVVAAAPDRRDGGEGGDRRHVAAGCGGAGRAGRRTRAPGGAAPATGRGAGGQVHRDRLDVTRGDIGVALAGHCPPGRPPSGQV